MHVVRVEAGDRRLVKAFLDLPEKLYHGNPYHVPAFRSDVRAYFDRKKNPFYKHSDAAFFLAVDEKGTPCGRIAVLEPSLVNARLGSHMAFFFLYESCEKLEVSRALFDACEQWAAGRGLDELYGPKGFTALDPIGILVDGFNTPAAMGTGYHHPYYDEYILASGFSQDKDLLTGTMTRNFRFPERIHRIAERVRRSRGITVEPFRSRRDVLEHVPEIAMLFNSALGSASVNAPMSVEEIRSMIRVLMLIAKPELIKLIRKGDEVIGFLLAYPDVGRAVRRSRGRLFPFGWLRMLVESRRTVRYDLNGVGILEEHRGAGGLAVLYSELHKTLSGGRVQEADVIQIRVENETMLRTLREFEVDFNRRHRMYRKQL